MGDQIYIRKKEEHERGPASQRAASLCRDGIILLCDDLQYITSRCVYSMCRDSTYTIAIRLYWKNLPTLYQEHAQVLILTLN